MKLATIALALASLLGASFAAAQPYPRKPVTIVVPYAPGGGTDVVARALANALSIHWKQTVIVDNTAGADGMIGTQKALRAPADGYTMILQLNTMLLWKGTSEGPGANLLEDIAFISLIQTAPLAFAVSSKFPGNTFGEFVAWCKVPANACSWGTATRYAQLIGKHLMETAGLERAVNIPYKGGGPMMNDLLGGHVTMTIPSVASSLTQKQAGSIKVLAVASRSRFKFAPDVPTLAEAGYPINGDSWYGLMVAKATPPEIVRAITEGVRAVSKDANLIATIEGNGGQPVFSSGEEFNDYVKRESQELGALLAKYPSVQ